MVLQDTSVSLEAAVNSEPERNSIYMVVEKPSLAKIVHHYAVLPFKLNPLADIYVVLTASSATVAATAGLWLDEGIVRTVLQFGGAAGAIASAVCGASIYKHGIEGYLHVRKVISRFGRIDKKAFDPLLAYYCTRQGGKCAADLYNVTPVFWNSFNEAQVKHLGMSFTNIPHF